MLFQSGKPSFNRLYALNIQLFPCHVCSQGVYGQLYRYCVVTETDYVGMLPANDVPDRSSLEKYH